MAKFNSLFKALLLGLTFELSEAVAAPLEGEFVARNATINSDNSRNLRIDQSSPT